MINRNKFDITKVVTTNQLLCLSNFRQFEKFIVASTQHRQLFESSTRSRDQSRIRTQAKKTTRIQIEKKREKDENFMTHD